MTLLRSDIATVVWKKITPRVHIYLNYKMQKEMKIKKNIRNTTINSVDVSFYILNIYIWIM